MTPWITLIKTTNQKSVKAGHLLGVLLLFATVGLLIVEMVSRTLFGVSVAITEEYAGYFAGAAMFLGAAYALLKDKHIKADVIAKKLPMPVQRPLELLTIFIGFCVSCILVYALTLQWWDAWSYQSQSFYPSRTPLWIPLAAPLVGSALLAYQILNYFLKKFKTFVKGNKHA